MLVIQTKVDKIGFQNDVDDDLSKYKTAGIDSRNGSYRVDIKQSGKYYDSVSKWK